MALPKRKTSKRKHATRQAHQAYSTPNLSTCPQCHSVKPSHQVCPVCGVYKGQQVITTSQSE